MQEEILQYICSINMNKVKRMQAAMNASMKVVDLHNGKILDISGIAVCIMFGTPDFYFVPLPDTERALYHFYELSVGTEFSELVSEMSPEYFAKELDYIIKHKSQVVIDMINKNETLMIHQGSGISASESEYKALYDKGFVVFGSGFSKDKGPTKYINVVALIDLPEFLTINLDTIHTST